MLIEGVILGGITLAGMGVAYKRLPAKVQAFVCKHPLITDAVCVVFFYNLMGMTLVAHVAVATMTLGTQALLHMERNKADYQFIYDLMNQGKVKMALGLKRLQDWAREQNEPIRQIEEVK